MEFCAGEFDSFCIIKTVPLLISMPGGGIIDLLNKRLRDRLKEVEILNIFTDVCEVS